MVHDEVRQAAHELDTMIAGVDRLLGKVPKKNFDGNNDTNFISALHITSLVLQERAVQEGIVDSWPKRSDPLKLNEVMIKTAKHKILLYNEAFQRIEAVFKKHQLGLHSWLESINTKFTIKGTVRYVS